MAAAATRDLLAVTSSLFDKSDEIYDETKKLARAVQSRKAPADAAELRRIAAAGVDGSALAHLNTVIPGAGDLTALALALAQCKDAAAAIASLQEQRDAVVEARREAIEVRETAMAASRDKLKADLQASASETQASYLAKLRDIVAKGAAAPAPTPAPAAAESAALAEAVAPAASEGSAAAPAASAAAEPAPPAAAVDTEAAAASEQAAATADAANA